MGVSLDALGSISATLVSLYVVSREGWWRD